MNQDFLFTKNFYTFYFLMRDKTNTKKSSKNNMNHKIKLVKLKMQNDKNKINLLTNIK